MQPSKQQQQPNSSKTRPDNANKNQKVKQQKAKSKEGKKQQSQQTVYERMIRARATSALNLIENETQSSARGLPSRLKHGDNATKSREFQVNNKLRKPLAQATKRGNKPVLTVTRNR